MLMALERASKGESISLIMAASPLANSAPEGCRNSAAGQGIVQVPTWIGVGCW